jgi:hypothetical protein
MSISVHNSRKSTCKNCKEEAPEKEEKPDTEEKSE